MDLANCEDNLLKEQHKWCFPQFGTICTIQKMLKTPIKEYYF